MSREYRVLTQDVLITIIVIVGIAGVLITGITMGISNSKRHATLKAEVLKECVKNHPVEDCYGLWERPPRD